MGVFCIGKFPEEDDAVAVFPKIWMLDGTSQCYWPNKNVRKSVSKQKIPDEETWTLCEVVILQEFDSLLLTSSLLEAQRNLNLATVTSDLESTDKRKHKRVVRTLPPPPAFDAAASSVLVQAGENAHEINEDVQGTNIDFVGINEDVQALNADFLGINDFLGTNDDGGMIIESIPVVETVHASTQTQDSFESEEIIQGVQKAIAGIQGTVKEHSETLELILNHVLSMSGAPVNSQQQHQHQVELIQENFTFPMTSETVLLELNSYLSTETGKFSLMRYLTGTGGVDAEEAVKRILEKLMTDDLASKYSLRGKRGKKALSQYGNFIMALMDCVRSFPSLTIALNTGRLDEIPLENAVSSALKKASDRVFQRKRKATAAAQQSNEVPSNTS